MVVIVTLDYRLLGKVINEFKVVITATNLKPKKFTMVIIVTLEISMVIIVTLKFSLLEFNMVMTVTNLGIQYSSA